MSFTSKLSVQSIFKKVKSVGNLLHMDGFAFQVSLTKKQHLQANSSGFSTRCKSMKNGWAPHMLKALPCKTGWLWNKCIIYSFIQTFLEQKFLTQDYS